MEYLKLSPSFQFDEKITSLHDELINAAYSAELILQPGTALESRLPCLIAQMLFFVPSKGEKIGLFATIGAFTLRGAACEWEEMKPICFLRSPEGPSWMGNLQEIARKIAEAALIGVEWGLDNVQQGLTLPMAFQSPREMKITMSPWHLQKFEIPDNKTPVRLMEGSTYGFSCNNEMTVAVHNGSRLICIDLLTGQALEGVGVLIMGNPIWFPDNRRLLTYSCSGSNDGIHQQNWGSITVVDVVKGTSKLFYHNGSRWVQRCHVSPNGDEIAVVLGSVRRHGYELMALTASGELSRTLYKAEPGVLLDFPVWTPDGESIYLSLSGEQEEERHGLWSIDISERKPPTQVWKGKMGFPALSPSGKHLAFVDYSKGSYPDYEISLLEIESKKVHPLAEGWGGISWTPDGEYLLYCKHGGDEGLYIQQVHL